MTGTPPPFSRPFGVVELPPGGRAVSIEASEAERAVVAGLYKVPAVLALGALFEVRRFGQAGAEVRGEVRARLTQTCVVTGEEFDSDVAAPVEIRFSPDGVDPNSAVDVETLLDPDAEDPPDLLVGGRIDLGDIAVEFLALELDPYPRKPGVEFEAEAEDGADDEAASPFEALAALLGTGHDSGKDN